MRRGIPDGAICLGFGGTTIKTDIGQKMRIKLRKTCAAAVDIKSVGDAGQQTAVGMPRAAAKRHLYRARHVNFPFHSVMGSGRTIVLPDVYGGAMVICETNVIEVIHQGL